MGGPSAFELDTTSTFAAPLDGLGRTSPTALVHGLSWTDQDGQSRRVLIDQDQFLIGRVAPANLVLEGGMVSRRHCELAITDGALTLTDLGSTNGTYVDGDKVVGTVPVPDGCVITIGPYHLRYQCRDVREAEAALALDRDLSAARDYVTSILPGKLTEGPVRAEWVFEPSARLGGDAFGYQMLDDRHFALFLLDVTGHGAGSALHAVSVANALRQRLLPGVDFRSAGAVVQGLNTAFPMDAHNDLMFTIWYGVLDLVDRTLTYAGAGHHPAYLIMHAGAAPTPLSTRNPSIGMLLGRDVVTASILAPPGAVLCLFSDGVFEVTDRNGRDWTLNDLLPLLPLAAGDGGADRLRQRQRELLRPGPLEDDYSFLRVFIP